MILCLLKYGQIEKLDWTLDWTMDWTLDWTLDSRMGYKQLPYSKNLCLDRLARGVSEVHVPLPDPRSSSWWPGRWLRLHFQAAIFSTTNLSSEPTNPLHGQR